MDEWLSANHGAGLRVSMISAGKAIIYNPLLYRNHKTTRIDKPLREIITEVSGGVAPSKPYILLDVSAEDDEGDVVIPQVQLYLA
jgi:hypothetical protein